MNPGKRFERLLEPGYIGKVRTRNRIVKTGAGTFMWHEDETAMNRAILAYYESLARGGVGLLIVESPTIDYPIGARGRQRLDDDKYIKGLSQLPAVIHRHGCPTFMQMNHDGPWQIKLGLTPDPPGHGPPIAASAVTLKSENDFHNETPHAMTVEEIEAVIDKFAAAAVRAEKAGFDGVDVNAASSHLLHNFLSPFWNRRQDSYGGSPENRARIVTSIIKEIKKRLGGDFPVSVCINAIEIGRLVGVPDDNCVTTTAARATARLLEAAGADNLHIRSHWLGYHVGAYLTDVFFFPEPPIPPDAFPPEYDSRHRGAAVNVPLAAGIKREVNIPVMTVAKLDPYLGEKALRAGKVDFIGMTRRLQADPDLPNKVAAGKLDDIAPCTACENCLGSRRCRINAFMGADFNTIEPAARKKRVVVVGGGPAGMEAARVAARRGHDVTLYEKSTRLGGLLPLAALVKGTELEDLPAMVRYLKRQIKKLGVNVKTGQEVDADAIIAARPDAVVLASGGLPAAPEIPGIDRPGVVSSAALHRRLKSLLRFLPPGLLRWLTKIWMPVGKRVVIIGGGLHGCELAEFLTRRGRRVTVVAAAGENLGEGMVDVLMAYLFRWFQEKGVTLVSGVKEMEVTAAGLEIVTADGERQVIPADTVIPTLPLRPNMNLYASLKGKVPELYAVGDCREPLLIADAIGTGLRTARTI